MSDTIKHPVLTSLRQYAPRIPCNIIYFVRKWTISVYHSVTNSCQFSGYSQVSNFFFENFSKVISRQLSTHTPTLFYLLFAINWCFVPLPPTHSYIQITSNLDKSFILHCSIITSINTMWIIRIQIIHNFIYCRVFMNHTSTFLSTNSTHLNSLILVNHPAHRMNLFILNSILIDLHDYVT